MLKPSNFYCQSFYTYKRLITSVTVIGNTPLGGEYPIRVQSMTTTDTMDTLATVAQSIRIVEAGGEYVRITAPTAKDAENLRQIKQVFREKGYQTPLVADIHFQPKAAEVAAGIVEKIRINPGNFVDKKKFEHLELSLEEYNEEIEKIRQKLVPIIQICKAHKTAIRIGTNHGSLSDRILSKYGDTPLGMAEATLEFLRICKEEYFKDIVISLKASNTRIMVQAVRLLSVMMREEGMSFPMHLGVTEAGEGEDGRIKSAVGIGALLNDGIGDTVRVSLTEEPEAEIPVAKKIVNYCTDKEGHANISDVILPEYFDPYQYNKRTSKGILNIGGKSLPVVITDFSDLATISTKDLTRAGYTYQPETDKWNYAEQAADYIYVGSASLNVELPLSCSAIVDLKAWKAEKKRTYPIAAVEDYITMKWDSLTPAFVLVDQESLNENTITWLVNNPNSLIVLLSKNRNFSSEIRAQVFRLHQAGCNQAIIVKKQLEETDKEDFQIKSACDTGGLFIDGLVDGLWLVNAVANTGYELSASFGILQASRVRTSKTEYISCPACGRTLFNLQQTSAKIRVQTSHLTGLKIGIMGCIVNGPGEMADADYGYVGAGPGKITLYKGKEVIKKNVPEADAVAELVQVIKEQGDWKDPL